MTRSKGSRLTRFQTSPRLSMVWNRETSPPMLWPTNTIWSIAGSSCRGSTDCRSSARSRRNWAALIQNGWPVGYR